MTDLMTDDTHKLVIAHDIHERREYADAAVGAGKRVDVDDMIYLEVQWNSISIGYTFGKLAKTLSVGIVFRQNRIVLVHPVNRLLYICRHLGIGKSGCLNRFRAGAHSFLKIELSHGWHGAK